MDEFHPQQHFGYLDQTVLDPLGLIAILVLGTAMLIVPRRYAVWPMIVMGCFVAPAQRVAIFTLNFDLLRIMVLFGTVRIFARGEWKSLRLHAMDIALAAFAIVGTTVFIANYATPEAVKYKLGVMYDILGMYFLFRCLVRDFQDVSRIGVGFAIVSVPVMLAFIAEKTTGRNVFSVFGGVPETTLIRDGRMRCQGAYAHPILAGSYWASLMPLLAALWWGGSSNRKWAVIGVTCGMTIIFLCASSTPLAAVGFGVIGFACFFVRRSMRLVRWGIVALLILMQLLMQKPIWHLVGRLDLAGGSTGYYRFTLIDATIRHFNDWWLLGGMELTEKWGHEYNHYLTDITNQYVLEGLRGGVWSLVLFIAVIILAFSAVGRVWRRERENKANLMMAWALGVCLFVHCMIFIGVSYFGQITMIWYLTLAMIGSMNAQPRPAKKRAAVRYRFAQKPTWRARWRQPC